MVSDQKRNVRPSIHKQRSTGFWYIAASIFLPPSRIRKLDDEWIAPQREAAIAHIIDEVGRSPEDRNKLAESIFDACIEVRSRFDPLIREAPKSLKTVQQILKWLRKCATLIDSDPHLSERINKDAGGLVLPPFARLQFDLEILENELRALAKRRRSKFAVELNCRRPSELEWLAGVALPLVYERNFSGKAGRSRTQKKPGGPTVRFIAATLKELGLFYSYESIVRAMSRLKAFRREKS